MTPFHDKAARARIVALHAAVIEHDAALIALTGEMQAATIRRAALDDRLAAERGRAPIRDTATDDLAAQLAADPAADVAASAKDRLRKSRAATADRADAESAVEAVVAQAAAAVDAEIAAMNERTVARQEARQEAWAAFVRGAHEALTAEFRARWGQLMADVVKPMLALGDEKIGTGPQLIVGGFSDRLTFESALVLIGPAGREYLLPGGGAGPSRRYPDALPALIATLTA